MVDDYMITYNSSLLESMHDWLLAARRPTAMMMAGGCSL
jgi:hypothetical protein